MYEDTEKRMRINKYLAECGVASRRGCDKLIEEGRVTVNGKTAALGDDIAGGEEICVDGVPVSHGEKHSYYLLNKPKGYVCTVRDDKGRKTVMELLPPDAGRVFPVGRLDYDTEGMLLLTDDGDLAHRMLTPKSHVYKLYQARLDKPATREDAALFAQGLRAGELECLPAELILGDDPCEVRVRVREGKFHQIKRMFHAVGKEVIYLKRLAIGNLKLDPTLALGQTRLLTEEELTKIFE